jgi:DNA polymerase V
MIGQGGARPGSGRKSHGYKTVVRRVPEPLLSALDAATAVLQQAQKLPSGALFPALSPTRQALPLFAEAVPMGFPSPAEGYIERRLDLNEHLIRNPAATFFLRATGDSLRGTCAVPHTSGRP